MAAPSSRTAPLKSSPDCGVWGDVEDWHSTLDLIAGKWGSSSSYLARISAGADERQQQRSTKMTDQHAPVLGPSLKGVAQTRDRHQEKEALPEADKPRTRRPAELLPHPPAAGSLREGRPPISPSRKQRHTASLPRPSDVEALLRKETQKRRPSSPSPQPPPSSSPPTASVSATPLSARAEETPDGKSTTTTVLDRDGGANEDPPSPSARTKLASSYSAPTDLREAFVSVNHSAGVPNNEGLVLPLHELQKRPVPSTLNKATLEVYLSDDEFSSALGMPRDQFYSLRAWKQTQVKKKAGLL